MMYVKDDILSVYEAAFSDVVIVIVKQENVESFKIPKSMIVKTCGTYLLQDVLDKINGDQPNQPKIPKIRFKIV